LVANKPSTTWTVPAPSLLIDFVVGISASGWQAQLLPAGVLHGFHFRARKRDFAISISLDL
jgi:hypothetical protein